MNDTPAPIQILRERLSSRLLIFDPRNEAILLLSIRDPNLSAKVGEGRVCWVTPGGGAEPGETPEETARRELQEETGLIEGQDAFLGPFLGERRLELVFGLGDAAERLLSVERYFAVRLAAEPAMVSDAYLLPYERSFIDTYHWWTAAEIRRATSAGTDAFFPEDLLDYFAVFPEDWSSGT